MPDNPQTKAAIEFMEMLKNWENINNEPNPEKVLADIMQRAPHTGPLLTMYVVIKTILIKQMKMSEEVIKANTAHLQAKAAEFSFSQLAIFYREVAKDIAKGAC